MSKEILEGLQKPLEVNQIDFRAAEVRSEWVTVLAYKDARVDMCRLDEVTNGMWQNEYKRDSQGVLQCGIGIKIGDEWIWKWSNGVPSNFEKQKGEYSDAFKRAGFMWGIGRELYDYPRIFTKLQDDEITADKAGKTKVSYKFKPNDWTWKIERDGEKWHIQAYDNTHEIERFACGKYRNTKA